MAEGSPTTTPRVSRRYAGFRYLLHAWVRRSLTLTIDGLDNVPPAGPAVLVGNHPSALDGFVILSVVPRRVCSFRRHDNLPMGLFARTALFSLAVPAVTGSRKIARNLDALGLADAALDRGDLLLTLPEGDVHPPQCPGLFETGFVFLSWRAHSPIIPVALAGTELTLPNPSHPRPWDWLRLRRAEVSISFLAPITFDGPPATRRQLRERADFVQARIASAIGTPRHGDTESATASSLILP